MRQSCVAQVQINPEETPELFERNYDLRFGGSVYDDYNSGSPTSLPDQEASYYVPSSDFEFKEVETSSSMFQEFTSAEYYYHVADLDPEETGEIVQRFKGNFETNPYDDDLSDKLNMVFQMDAPDHVLRNGRIAY
jgi:hypothetical protein